MRNQIKLILTLTIAVRLQAQDATTKHFVITDNNVYRAANSASSFEFTGAALTALPSLETTGWGLGSGFFGTRQQTFATVGTNLCAFVSDPGSDDIASFNATDLASPVKVGNYVDPTGSGARYGIALAAHGTSLYAGYSASLNIGVWTINANCSLTSANAAVNTPTLAPVNDIAVSPDGKTLIATFSQTSSGVGSYNISGSTLSSTGLYFSTGPAAGIDITKGNKFAIIADYSGSDTEVSLFPINGDSSLGSEDFYYIRQGGANSNNLWLSPDETAVYVSNNISLQITTLTFTASAPAGQRLTFTCISNALSPPAGGALYNTVGLATEATTGKGGYLYVAENSFPSAIAVMQIPANGCPVEIPGSPFANPAGSFTTTVSAYPPRPF